VLYALSELSGSGYDDPSGNSSWTLVTSSGTTPCRRVESPTPPTKPNPPWLAAQSGGKQLLAVPKRLEFETKHRTPGPGIRAAVPSRPTSTERVALRSSWSRR
jgi:hypothetical protein